MTPETLKKRTKEFAHRCIKLALALPKTRLGLHIQGQLKRCSSSVAANYRASFLVQSKPAFIAKRNIVVEESGESSFWLEFIVDENLLEKAKVQPLINESNELAKIFISSRMTASGKPNMFEVSSTLQS